MDMLFFSGTSSKGDIERQEVIDEIIFRRQSLKKLEKRNDHDS